MSGNPYVLPHDGGPQADYEALVRRGEIEADPVQRLAAVALDELHGELQDLGEHSLLSRLFGARQKAPRGIYLHGPVGRGKSMLMDLFVETSPVRVRRVHFHVFMQEVHARLFEWRQMDEKARRAVGFKGDDPVPPLARAMAADLKVLCLDELEVEDIADAMIVGRLFSGLLDEGVVMVVTSNRPPRDLYQGGINRQLFEPFVALIIERFRLVRLDADHDYRLGNSGRPYYLTPLSEKVRARMDALFKQLAPGSAKPATLSVQGRRIAVPEASGRVARFSFADLCARPLGSADYLAIAAHYDTLFLDDIPLLGRENRNEARRFVTLIDVVYDEGLELVASAAALPDRLYPEGDGQFEFQRTASRLEELGRGGRHRRPAAEGALKA
jgi:cell division protein ZapE